MTCQRCGARATVQLCRDCADGLYTMLVDLVIGPPVANGHHSPGLLEDLRDAATTQSHGADHATRARRFDVTPRTNAGASRVLADIHTELARIAAALPRGVANAPRPPRRTEALAIIVAGHLSVITKRDDAATIHRHLEQLTRRALHAIDLPAPRHTMPCLCGADLTVPADAATVTCRSCGITHDIDTLHRERLAGLVAAGQAFTVADFPAVMAMLNRPCSPRTFRHWRATGVLPVAGYDDDGQPLYRPADLAQRKTPRRGGGFVG